MVETGGEEATKNESEDKDNDDEEEANDKERSYFDRDDEIVDIAYSAKLERLKSIRAKMSQKGEQEQGKASTAATSDSDLLAIGAQKVLDTFFEDEESGSTIDAGSIERILRQKKEEK